MTGAMSAEEEQIQIRLLGAPALPALIYLPGLHGDWTLVSSFRAAIKDKAHFVEFTYPRIVTWSLDDYARAVVQKLGDRGITHGWILAESFSSQVAWKILQRFEETTTTFRPLGLILAGGFVRHPTIWGVRWFHAVHRLMPWACFRLLLKFYGQYARLRHRRAPETLASIAEFVARRTPQDRLAIASRYPLIAANDAREVAKRTALPVYALCGFFDPIVPWPLVLPWLRRNCPAFRESRIIFNADHNVLGTAPQKSAEQIVKWMNMEP
jgi:pimeloyl-ACP methyl ester carboxylesterase